MSGLNLTDCAIVLGDLLEDRAESVRLLPGGERHLSVLTALHAELVAALDARIHRKTYPVAELVRQHIEAAAALSAMLESHRLDPLAPPEERAAATRLEAELVEGRRGPAHHAGQRVEFALTLRARRTARQADLALLPPRVDALLVHWIELSEAIGRALSNRSSAAEVTTRSPQTLLRETRTALSKLRRAVRLEVEMNPDVAPDLERLVLGYIEEFTSPPKRPRQTESQALAVRPEAPESQAIAVPPEAPDPSADLPAPTGWHPPELPPALQPGRLLDSDEVRLVGVWVVTREATTRAGPPAEVEPRRLEAPRSSTW